MVVSAIAEKGAYVAIVSVFSCVVYIFWTPRHPIFKTHFIRTIPSELAGPIAVLLKALYCAVPTTALAVALCRYIRKFTSLLGVMAERSSVATI